MIKKQFTIGRFLSNESDRSNKSGKTIIAITWRRVQLTKNLTSDIWKIQLFHLSRVYFYVKDTMWHAITGWSSTCFPFSLFFSANHNEIICYISLRKIVKICNVVNVRSSFFPDVRKEDQKWFLRALPMNFLNIFCWWIYLLAFINDFFSVM